VTWPAPSQSASYSVPACPPWPPTRTLSSTAAKSLRPVRRQVFFPFDDNYFSLRVASRENVTEWVNTVLGAVTRPRLVFVLRERESGGGKVGNLLLVFHFSIRPSASELWECGNRKAISKDCGKRCVLSISPSFPQLLFVRRFLFGLLRLFDSIAWDVQLEDHAMMHEAIDRGSRRHRIFEDALPFRKRQVA
jgi:hypothetical protein